MKDLVQGIINIEADALTRFHGIKDNERVRRIFERIVTDCILPDIPDGEDEVSVVEGTLRAPTALDEALRYLPSEEALAVFESCGPPVLSQRSYLVDFLNDAATPFYTLKELADVAEEFVSHLEGNRELLVKIGLPVTSFERSKWFDHYLNRLYPVKLPVCLQANRMPLEQRVAELRGVPPELGEAVDLAERDAKGNLIYNYSWVPKCPLSGLLHWSNEGPSLGHENGSMVPLEPLCFCGYEDASIIHGLAPAAAQRIEESREKYLELKIDLLNTLTSSIRSPRKHEDVWEQSFRILRDALMGDQVHEYLQTDHLFENVGVGDHFAEFHRWVPTTHLWGGMSALIYVVGYFQKEMTIGTFDKTKSAVLEALPNHETIESYFQVIGKPFRSTFDDALDGFWELDKQERVFWEDFRKEVNYDLKERLRILATFNIPIEARFERRLRERYDPRLHAEARELEETRKFIGAHEDSQSGRLDVVLSDAQSKDYDDFQYKCHDRVHIPGDHPEQGYYPTVINDDKIEIGDSLFILFLQLVKGAKKKKGGWVNIQELQEKGHIGGRSIYQRLSDLRKELRGSLRSREGSSLIENDRRKGYRISTHPDFITYKKTRLLDYEDHRIKGIVKKLP